MTYNLKKIGQLINQALNEEELKELCFSYFRSVYDNFTDGQTVNSRKLKLIEYADKHQEISKLLEAIQEYNPTVYMEFLSEVGSPEKLKPELVPNNQTNLEPTNIKTCDVLVLAANPIDTDLLQLEQEAELIQQRLQEGTVGKGFVVKFERAVRVEDISKYLLQYRPLIIHFSGHGSPSGEIILNNSQGQAQAVSAEALAELLKIVQVQIECVLLNACFSLEKADVLAEQVNCVVGMDAEIDDESAVVFAAGFYRGLGFGRGYYTAFELGRNEINLSNLPNGTVPHFITRDTSIWQLKAGNKRLANFSTQKDLLQTILYPLWFGTNRQRIDSQDLSQGFSGMRDRQIHYGTCRVTVPKYHRIGSVGSPWWKRWLSGTDDRLKLDPKSLSLMDEASFFANIQQALQTQELDAHSALVFIHGFNVSFNNAALRAAQIGVDLKFQGIMAFYSWPSKGNLTGYTADEATIEASEQYIAEFLLNLAQKSSAKKVHIIAHSMGNRGLLRAMQRILVQVQAASDISFGQIFLAAPDVDPDLFEELAAAYQNLAERTTLYVSAKDKALATSGIIHDHPRIGFFPPITVVDGIDTVEVSNIDLTLLGHGYFADARDLLQDIHELLMYNTSPEKRFGLRLAQVREQKYWRIGN